MRRSYEDVENQNNRTPLLGADTSDAPPVLEEKGGIMGIYDKIRNTLRTYMLYHLIMIFLHYFVYGLAIASLLINQATENKKHKNQTKLAEFISIAVVVLGCLIFDIYLTRKNYKNETYFPYNAAPHFLFIIKGIRVDPTPPPNQSLYFTDKLIICMLGVVFALMPLHSALKNIKGGTKTDQVILFGYLIVIVIKIVNFVLFYVFYHFFIFEVLTRFFLYCVCIFRKRTGTNPPTDNAILASHESDPLYYNLYAWLYEKL